MTATDACLVWFTVLSPFDCTTCPADSVSAALLAAALLSAARVRRAMSALEREEVQLDQPWILSRVLAGKPMAQS